ncbi:MAG: 16S rRNA (cytosine(967)-C(5))-methyltransferase [Porticoccus sp.]|jgi:16S rRNA (cytosine967-C5)-methyltransferase|nr:16S rRNA (cytosine(967)-C(5))-methyltransferase [Porticoccus sp.]
MDARIATINIITGILKNSGSLSKLLPYYISKVHRLDQPLVRELSYGTLRYYPKFQLYINFLLKKPLKEKDKDIEAVLVCAIYQITETRVPTHAAVHESVEACKVLKKSWASSLVNAVLRRFMREKISIDAELAGSEIFESSHPMWLISALKTAWPNQVGSIVEANNSKPPMTLRVNENLSDQDKYINLLNKKNIGASPTKISLTGVTLKKPLEVSSLPNFSKGAVSVQDEAAQLSVGLLKLGPKQKILDACCAPGGKTGHILEYIQKNCQENSYVTCIDISKKRLDRVQENIDRLGLKAKLIVCDVLKTENWWDDILFDRILLDAPCSATGVIRRNPDIKLLRKPVDIDTLSILQLELLDTLWKTLKKDGLLLYATCSTLPQENDMVISEFLDCRSDAVTEKIDLRFGIQTIHGKQLLPSVDGHDGFYYARLRKL